MTKDTGNKIKRQVRNDGQFADRIRQLRLAAGLTQPQLAAKLGVTKNAVTNWEAGSSRPDISTLAGLCDALSVGADELLGRGVSNISVSEIRLIKRFRNLSGYDQQTLLNMIDLLESARIQEQKDRCRNMYRPMPLLPYAMGAGLGEPLGDALETEQVFVRNTKNSRRADSIVRVNGDSMMPTFSDGDLLLIEETDAIKEGEIGIFIVAGEGFVKEYQPDGLHSHNPKYKTIRPVQDDNFRCVGRVLDVITEDMLATPRELAVLNEIYSSKRDN